jgi:hypothetical protein
MPCLISPPPQAASALSIVTRLARLAETTNSQLYTEPLNAALAELHRSSFWQTKVSFEEARARLNGTATLRHGWDTYGAEAPNDDARKLAAGILDLLEASLLPPTRLMPSAEGGIALAFVSGDCQAGIEIYNTGEIAAATWSAQGAPIVWDLENSESALKKAIEQIRVHLAA